MQTTPPRPSLINTTTCVNPQPTHPPTHHNPHVQVREELAISLKHNLVSKLPFCAFNGGNDVFVDVGNKSLGLDAPMAAPRERAARQRKVVRYDFDDYDRHMRVSGCT